MTAPPGKPNLFIVGAMKCGKTAWYEYLRTHRDIFMSVPKEPSFFDFDVPPRIILQPWCNTPSMICGGG